MRAMFSVILAATLATAMPATGALADDDWPADCPKPNYSWIPLNWPTERALARLGCGLARKSSPAETASVTATRAPYTGYAPPPAIGPDASTEQPPVVDTLRTGGRAIDRCREAPASAMAAVVIPVELALCALSAPWSSEPTAAAPSLPAAADQAKIPSTGPLAANERDPAMR